MPIRPRTLLPLLIALAALVAAGCGGGDKADSGSDVNQLLEDTFSGKHEVSSGRLDLKLRLTPEGGDTGPVSLSLTGPFQTQGKGKLAKFDFDAAVEGAGQSFKAGLTHTGDKAFVGFQGTDYAVSDPVFKQFVAGYEQAQKQATEGQNPDQPTLATLGVDPRRWLKDARNAGEAKVGDTDTIKITGGVDVPKLLDDVNKLLERARSLGVQGSEDLPQRLTDEQRRLATEAIRDLKVEIYTGKEDATLRRLLVDLNVQAPEGTADAAAQSGALRLDFSILDMNEDQEIAAPADAKPFEELLAQFGGLDLGGALGGGGSGSGGDSGSGGGVSAEDLEKYNACIEQAGSDAGKVSQCADLLTP